MWLPDDSIIRAAGDGVVKLVTARPGEPVRPGQPLVESEEPEVEAGIRVLRSQLAVLNARLASEEFADRVQADMTRQEIQIKTAALKREQDKAALLVARSASEGLFVLPRAQDLPGRYFRRGDVIGYVTSTGGRIIRAIVTQDDLELVRSRLRRIEIKLANRLLETHAGSMLREVPAGSERLPSKALAEIGGGVLTSDPRDQNQTKTLQRTFQLDLALPSSAATEYFGTRAFVRFDHGLEPLGWQIYRRARQLFLSKFDA